MEIFFIKIIVKSLTNSQIRKKQGFKDQQKSDGLLLKVEVEAFGSYSILVSM